MFLIRSDGGETTKITLGLPHSPPFTVLTDYPVICFSFDKTVLHTSKKANLLNFNTEGIAAFKNIKELE